MEKEIDFGLIGRRIREVRTQRGLSQAQLAFDAGMQNSYICHVEKGEKQVSLKALVAIAEALQATADVFLYGQQKFDTTQYQSEFIEVLSGCDEFEKRIIFNAASAVKETIRNEYLLKKNRDEEKKRRDDRW